MTRRKATVCLLLFLVCFAGVGYYLGDREGYARAEKTFQEQAVDAEYAEFYFDENHNKAFRFLTNKDDNGAGNLQKDPKSP